MDLNQPVIALIEWSSESCQEPVVILAGTPAGARRAAAEYLKDYLPTGVWVSDIDDGEGEIDNIDSEWVEENPFPDLDDDAAVTTWLKALREATTDAWVTLYQPPETKDADYNWIHAG